MAKLCALGVYVFVDRCLQRLEILALGQGRHRGRLEVEPVQAVALPGVLQRHHGFILFTKEDLNIRQGLHVFRSLVPQLDLLDIAFQAQAQSPGLVLAAQRFQAPAKQRGVADIVPLLAQVTPERPARIQVPPVAVDVDDAVTAAEPDHRKRYGVFQVVAASLTRHLLQPGQRGRGVGETLEEGLHEAGSMRARLVHQLHFHVGGSQPEGLHGDISRLGLGEFQGLPEGERGVSQATACPGGPAVDLVGEFGSRCYQLPRPRQLAVPDPDQCEVVSNGVVQGVDPVGLLQRQVGFPGSPQFVQDG